MSTSVDDVPFGNRYPLPALYIATAIATIVEIILIVHYVISPTRRRALTIAAATGNLIQTTMIATSTYYSSTSTFEQVTIVFTGVLTAIEFDLLNAVFLDIGASFFPKRREARTALWWSSIIFIVVFNITGNLLALWYLADHNMRKLIILPLAIIMVSTVSTGISLSIIYALVPLVKFRTRIQNSIQGEAFAIGVWHICVVVPWLIIGVLFWVYAFISTHGNPFNDVTMAIDVTLRSLMCLSYGCPPYWKAVCFIRDKLGKSATLVAANKSGEWDEENMTATSMKPRKK